VKTIDVKGTIVSNDDKKMYTWFGMEAISPNDIKNALDAANGDDVTLNINSYGGDVAAGNEIYYLISQYKGHTTADISGMACSAASYLALAADKVRMIPSAAFMIHNVSSVAAGDYHSMDTTSNALKALGAGIAHAYSIKTGKSQEEILELMDKETWMSAKQALEYGFADEIINDTPIFANSAVGMLGNEARNRYKNMVLNSEAEKLRAKNKAQAEFNFLKLKEAKR
jgi:ATP-dependent Clp endopeptidase proteolytic subunit ClpP